MRTLYDCLCFCQASQNSYLLLSNDTLMIRTAYISSGTGNYYELQSLSRKFVEPNRILLVSPFFCKE